MFQQSYQFRFMSVPMRFFSADRYKYSLQKKEIYIRGFSSEVSEDDLKEVFSPYGTIVKSLFLAPKDQLSGKYWLAYDDAEITQKAIDEVKTIKGEEVNIQLSQAQGAKSVYVGGLSEDVTKESLEESFKIYGEIRSVKVITD